MRLTSKQLQAAQYLADNTTEEILFGGAAGGGKSAFGALWLLDRCTKFPGTRWLMGRSKLKTLKDTTLKTFFEISSKLGVSGMWTYNQQKATIFFNNGSEIVLKDLFLYPSDPNFDELGSLEISGAFIDEANQITLKAKNIVKSRIRFKLDENNIIPKMLMTCNPAKNWVYADYYKPDKDGKLSPKRKFIQALLSDNPHISKHYRENLLSLDEVSRLRLLDGEWEYDDDPSKLINYDAIIDLFTNSHIDQGTSFITADVARHGSDKAVIIAWRGMVAEEIITYDTSSLDMLADSINILKERYKVPNSRIIADDDGVGGGLVDFMKIRPFVNGSKALRDENYKNLKAQCYYKLAAAINKNELYIRKATNEQKQAIIEELEHVKSYKIDADTKMQVLPKDKVKEVLGRSPDYADAIMMRMWFTMFKPQVVYSKII